MCRPLPTLLTVLKAATYDGATSALSHGAPMPTLWTLQAVSASESFCAVNLTVSSQVICSIKSQVSLCSFICSRHARSRQPVLNQFSSVTSCQAFVGLLKLIVICLYVQFLINRCHLFAFVVLPGLAVLKDQRYLRKHNWYQIP